MLRIVRNKLTASSLGRAFIVTFFFVTLASCLFWLDFFRSYSAEVTVLVIPKSGTTQTFEGVADNMAELTSTLSFYDRVLRENDFIDDDFAGYAPDKRKEQWNNIVSVTKQNTSGVLVIRAIGETQERAKWLASQTAQTMFSFAGLYYNIKTDVDMRIVDGPLVSYVMERPLFYGGVSLLTSFSLTALFFFLLRIVPELIGRKKKNMPLPDTYPLPVQSNFDETLTRRAYPEFGVGESVPWIDPKKFIPEKPHVLSFENQSYEGVNTSSAYGSRTVKHAEAPVNLPTAYDEMDLPVADESSLPFEFEALPDETDIPEPQEERVMMTLQEESVVSAPSVEPVRGEPTQEEYRRRLNALLAHEEK